MAVRNKHVLSHGPVMAVLAGTAVAALKQRFGGDAGSGPAPSTPTPDITMDIPPRPRDLLRDYIRHVGGDPSAYKGRIPPHFFPQWGFPLAAKTLEGIPYPMFKVLNGGCRLEIGGDLPADETLHARACLHDIDDDGRRAVLHQIVTTGTDTRPDALVAHMYAIVPLGGGKSSGGTNRARTQGSNGAAAPAAPPAAPPAKKERPRVPSDAEELQRWKLRLDAGLDFAKLTGDFNPVHWVTPYARAFGFKNRILHGFSTMARAIEGLQRTLMAGSTTSLTAFDCKFTRPLVLPARVGLYVKGRDVWVGDAPGGPAYLVGSFED